MQTEHDESKVIEVFSHVDTHRRIAKLIKQHSTNRDDIRLLAFAGLDLNGAKDILELGCGFGAFMEALQGRVHSDALLTGLDIVPAYEQHFLDACRQAGIRGRFLPSGVSRIDAFGDNTYDFILCGFALYFFPHAIPQIARILKPKGLFIAITHDRKNMGELIRITKGIMQMNGIPGGDSLPIERIVGRFSSENGRDLLKRWFGRIRTIDYRNSLVFQPGETEDLTAYFRFKSPLFLGETPGDMETAVQRIVVELERSPLIKDGLRLSKNDRVFICSDPFKGAGDT